MKKKLLVLFILGLSTNIFSQSTIYVAKTGNNIGSTGLSIAPFATIQAAIDYSTNGDTVIVNPGTYTENIIYNGKNITITSLYSSTLDESYISSTVIDGNANGTPVVRIQNGESNNAKLVGLTIQNGLTGSNEKGAGIHIMGSNTSPILDHLIVQNNNSFSGVGGGIRISAPYGKTTMNHMIFRNNTSSSAGGAISIFYSKIELKNSKIYGNSAPGNGSAISFHLNTGTGLSDCPITNCEIYSNTGENTIAGTGIVLLNCTFYNNNGTIQSNGDSAIINSIIASGHPIINQSLMKITNSLIQDDVSNINTPVPTNLTLKTINVISALPQFENAATNNFKLTNNSPAIGSGISTVQYYLDSNNQPIVYNAPTFDIDGNLRPNPIGSNPDIGAYENKLAQNLLSINTNVLSTEITLYPNPSSSKVIIKIPESLKFKVLEIYNTLGQRIKTFKEKEFSVEFLSTGTYLIKIVTDQGTAFKNFIKE